MKSRPGHPIARRAAVVGQINPLTVVNTVGRSMVFTMGMADRPGGVRILPQGATAMTDKHSRAREALLNEIAAEVRATAGDTGRAELAPAVIDALRTVPRHAFVETADHPLAYANRPLAIASGQTISQPFIVALMTDLLDLTGRERVLEVGSGSGYQAAVLSGLADRVYSVEIIPALAEHAAGRLARLGCDNVEVRCGNGRDGWPEHAPYDAVIVTAAARSVPPRLIEQLKPGGVMVIPLGGPRDVQELVRLSKDVSGHIASRVVLKVAFVPLTGDDPGGQG